MPRPLRVLIDECISSPRFVGGMRKFLSNVQGSNADTLQFLKDFIGERGVQDEVWVPKVASEGFDLILTMDQGRGTKGDKLPELCEKHGITHILVSGKLAARGLEVVAFAILGVWPMIRHACEESSLRFRLTTACGHKHEVGEYRFSLEQILATKRSAQRRD